MEKNERISVIVPVYKVEPYLQKCVDSIRNQTYENLEIILVDDGSPDHCGRMCDAFQAQDPRIRVIHKKNGGLSSARNAGLDEAKGAYIAFVDSDDWLEPDAMEVLMTAAQNENVKLVCGGRYDVSGASGERKIGLCPPKAETIPGKELVRRIFRWENVDSAAWDKLYHRSLFREIRYPVGKIVEDVPTTYRLALDAGRAAMVPKPVYNYYHRPGSITNSAISEKTFHFSQHTGRILQDIQEREPDLIGEATYLWIRSLAYNVQTLDLADEAAREKYAQEYETSKEELKNSMGFILTSSLFSAKEKREYLLMAQGLYRPLRRLYHLIKK